MFRHVLALTLVLAAAQFLLADDENLTITPKGYGTLEVGQIGHGYYKMGSKDFIDEISHVWEQRVLANFGFTAVYNDRLTIDLVGEGMMAFSNPQVGDEPQTTQPRNFYYIKSANVQINLLDQESTGLKLQVGYFPYKYNPDVRNLGEYMFRTLPYPLVVYADFDYPQITMLGARLNATFLDKHINNDLLLHSETVAHPVQNWSVSDVIETKFLNAFTVGGGVCLYHVFSAYLGDNIGGTAINRKFNWKSLSGSDLIGVDTTIEYNATKLMARAAIDLKQVFTILPVIPIDLFGTEDLHLYGEFNLLGTKNYPVYYENSNDRKIWTFGINIPAFKFLDVVSYEFEYCANTTAFSDGNFYSNTPTLLPVLTIGQITDPVTFLPVELERAKTRWSLYIKKKLFNDHFNLIAQVARDHKKINFYYFDKQYMSFQETLPTKKDWWWVFKTEYTF